MSHEVRALGMFLDITGHCVCFLTVLGIVWIRNIHLHLLVDQRHQLDEVWGMVLPPSGSRAGACQTRAKTRAHANPQPEIVNRGQPQVASPEREQEQVVQDAPSTVPVVVPIVALPTDVVIRLLNVLESLMPNHGRVPVPQTNSQAQTQV
ncbi:hypothetical protein HAX54_046898 [Datura stramonium]|uniref:Uncharacterized protein n=1 Tax=Datura stramonium TaxID=4076 RepID=A0ABS8WJS5_DATST|nr:hypothetical protein [Datura stramonium]